jgi:hypothetical protein
MIVDILAEIDGGGGNKGHVTVWHPSYQPKAKYHAGGESGITGYSHVIKSEDSSGLDSPFRPPDIDDGIQPIDLVVGKPSVTVSFASPPELQDDVCGRGGT